MEILSATYIPTALRDIAEYKLRFPRTDDTVYVYSAHLKAGNPFFSNDDEDLQRLAEVTILRDNYLNYFPEGTKFIISGDLNLYKSTEPAYVKLLAGEPGNYGQSFDPINRPGNWHNSSSFADIHSQSTRTTDLGDDGSTGGMDDRFDFILVSAPLLEKVIPGSYKAFGNDGNHFNQAINSGTNSAVSTEVANALHSASDHLPVIVEIDFTLVSGISDEVNETPERFKLEQNYPNPFNPKTIINYELRITSYVTLNIYNMLGQEIAVLVSETQSAGNHAIEWDGSGFASGIYYYIIRVGNFQQVKKMVLFK
jgi:endonuclease/exonuclease/phosphatase family metal-dependent hydrolase